MKTVQMEISKLKHPEVNTRKHPEKQLKEFGKSLEMFGQTRPVIIDEKNIILIGNGMVMAMQAKGWEKADVLKKTGLTEPQKKKLMLADNKIYSLGVDDPEAQFAIIEEIIGKSEDFEIPGFDEDVLRAFVASEDDINQGIENYGSNIAPPEPGQDGTGSFLDNNSPANESNQGAGEPNESGQPASGVEKTPGESMTQVRCPHCGEMIWV